MPTSDPDEKPVGPDDWYEPVADDGADGAEKWADEPVFAEEGGPRRPGFLAWIAGGAVLALIVLALIWGIGGFGRVEPTATPTATQIKVFQATPTPTVLAGAIMTPTASLPITGTAATPTPAPIVGAQIRVGGRVRIINADPEGISFRFGPGQTNQRITTLNDGVELTVMEPPPGYPDPYPTAADGFTWWRLRQDDGTIGWAAENWLQPIN